MPDARDPNRAAREAARTRAYHDVMADLDTGNTTHLAAAAITACGLCDDRGYRGSRVCDHVDRAETATNGIAKCRDALAKARRHR